MAVAHPLPSGGFTVIQDAAHLEPGVDRLAFQGQHPEDALVYAVQRLVPDEPLQRLDAEPELADREGALATKTAAT